MNMKLNGFFTSIINYIKPKPFSKIRISEKVARSSFKNFYKKTRYLCLQPRFPSGITYNNKPHPFSEAKQ